MSLDGLTVVWILDRSENFEADGRRRKAGEIH